MNGSSSRGFWLQAIAFVGLTLLVVPAVAGLAGAMLPAFGFSLPWLDASPSLEPWRLLSASPAIFRSAFLAIWIGFAATVLSLVMVIAMLAQFHDSRVFWLVRRLLSPLLSVPHAAIAVGLAFIIAPSGLLVRFLAQFLPGLSSPPDLLIVHDSYGISLIAALILKEVPFLFLMSLAALPQTDAHRSLAVAQNMGYRPAIAWLKAVLPRLYPQLRLPVIAVLAYSISVVDAALIVGPTTPPPLAVTVFKWMNDPLLEMRLLAAAGALLILAITVCSIAVWLAAEQIAAWAGRRWIDSGNRDQGRLAVAIAANASALIFLVFVLLSSAAILLWAFAEDWPYPALLPHRLSIESWRNSLEFAMPLWNALLIGAIAAFAALIIAVSLLERDVQAGTRDSRWLGHVTYVPLIVPQIAFLPGLQILLIAMNFDATLYAVIAVHLVFVLPYVYLSLREPWMHFDDRCMQAALALGATPKRALFQVKLPILLAPLLTAAAVGFAVSIGQYLPTLLVGAGRVPTITTEAVALASGGDRRLVAKLAMLQALLPFTGFLFALTIPAVVFKNRRGVRGQ